MYMRAGFTYSDQKLIVDECRSCSIKTLTEELLYTYKSMNKYIYERFKDKNLSTKNEHSKFAPADRKPRHEKRTLKKMQIEHNEIQNRNHIVRLLYGNATQILD